MTISRRLSLAAAAAVAVAIALASVGAYVAVRVKLRDQVDATLRARAEGIQQASRLAPRFGSSRFFPGPGPGPRPPQPVLVRKFGAAAGVVQLIAANGTVSRPPGQSGVRLPVTATVRAVASGRGGTTLADASIDGRHLRVITAPLAGGGAVEIALPLGDVDSTLHGLIELLAAITAGGVAFAVIFGALVARTALAPIRRFTERTEEIAESADLTSHRLSVSTNDELGRLAHTYNATLDALALSVAAQRQMISDASHELRTPLASLKANLEVLLRGGALGADDRRDLTRDLVDQADELTWLVEDVIELARNGKPSSQLDDVRLDELVAATIERVRPHAGGLEIRLEVSEPAVVRGDPERLGRAVRNLLDNAVKWSPAGGTIEVAVHGGTVSVRDHGEGIDPDDLAHVFERFYRAATARSMPGSGLGLAIVRQVAEAHGGTVSATNAPGGGAMLRLDLPAVASAL